MNLESIGFYTLEDSRAENVSIGSPLWRCELILTDVCNFKCAYCRGLREDLRGTMLVGEAKKVIGLWANEGLKNIRFSGGEPALLSLKLAELCKYASGRDIERIAVSTNGSLDIEYYTYLVECGVNDFSISLDACCAATGDQMAGGIMGSWNKVITNIAALSKLTYTTVGIVINEDNLSECLETIYLADSLGVHDIRVIPSAQYNKLLEVVTQIPQELLDKYPVLNYRVNNIKKGRNVRGIQAADCSKCPLVLDDMAVAGGYHFPCIIYLREYGKAIGKVSSSMRQERLEWYQNHDTHKDPICSRNCLDVCIDYNNKVEGV
jgi:MoaA/NifB/PqqE/SkfB family radical SAM enzyme